VGRTKLDWPHFLQAIPLEVVWGVGVLRAQSRQPVGVIFPCVPNCEDAYVGFLSPFPSRIFEFLFN